MAASYKELRKKSYYLQVKFYAKARTSSIANFYYVKLEKEPSMGILMSLQGLGAVTNQKYFTR